MKNKKEIDQRLIAYLSGSADPEDREQIRAWINQSQENANYFDELKKYHQLATLARKPSGYDPESGWDRVKAGYYKSLYQKTSAEFRKNRSRFIRRMTYSVAASLLIAFFLGSFSANRMIFSEKRSSLIYNQIDVPLGAKTEIRLPDGSMVWLNAGSSFRYPARFSRNERLVYLEGEGYFDVTSNRKVPFVVNASGVRIKALGTTFNVKAYRDEPIIEATLLEGVVVIEKEELVNPIRLHPNQKAIFYKDQGLVDGNGTLQSRDPADVDAGSLATIKEVEIFKPEAVDAETSWKDEKWIIRNETLKDLAIMLERRYDVQIEFDSSRLEEYKYSGTLMDESLEQVLYIISLTSPLQYKVAGKKVFFEEDANKRDLFESLYRNSTTN